MLYWSKSFDVWDDILSAGVQVFATGTTDQHGFENFDSNGALAGNPESRFIVVSAPTLTKTDILTAIVRGHFYLSNGAQIDIIEMKGRTLTVEREEHRIFASGAKT